MDRDDEVIMPVGDLINIIKELKKCSESYQQLKQEYNFLHSDYNELLRSLGKNNESYGFKVSDPEHF